MYKINPLRITPYIKFLLRLSISFDKNSIETAQPIPPIMIATVYSIVLTLITLVAYVGNIGTRAAIAAPCKRIPGTTINGALSHQQFVSIEL